MMTDYLLELNGDLLLVSRFVNESTFRPKRVSRTCAFKVHKLDWNMQEWTEVASIDHHAILLGNYSSKSLVAAGGNYFKANCIYIR